MNENLIARLEQEKIVTATFRRLGQDKKRLLFDTSRDFFAFDEFDRVTLDHIAESAEISKGSLIQYFTIKENLLRFVSEILLDRYRSHCEEYFRKESEPRCRQRLLDYFTAHFRFWRESPGRLNFYFRYFLASGQLIPENISMGLVDIMRDNLESIAVDGINGSEIRRDISIERILLILLSLQEGIMREISYDPENIDDETVYNSLMKMIDIVFDGIAGERKIRSLTAGGA